MEKKFKLLPPQMPNFIHYEVPPRARQAGILFDNTLPVSTLSAEEAEQYGQLMKEAFLEHWKQKVQSAV